MRKKDILHSNVIICHFILHSFRPAFRLDLVAHFGKTNRKKVEKSMKRKGVFRPPDKYLTDEELQAVRPIEEVAASIDTTLTDEQKEYVAKLRKKMRGGDRSPRCT